MEVNKGVQWRRFRQRESGRQKLPLEWTLGFLPLQTIYMHNNPKTYITQYRKGKTPKSLISPFKLSIISLTRVLFTFSETDIEWYLQVERLPCRPLSLSFNDSQYFISLRREIDREKESDMKQFVTKWMTIKRDKKNIDRKKAKIDKLTWLRVSFKRLKSLLSVSYQSLISLLSVSYQDKMALCSLIIDICYSRGDRYSPLYLCGILATLWTAQHIIYHNALDVII